jgi:Domain of unknown function (DUF2383)
MALSGARRCICGKEIAHLAEPFFHALAPDSETAMRATSSALERDTPLYNPALDTPRETGALNGLLRGELAAIECYDQVLEKYPTASAIRELRRIRVEHYAASRLLREHVRLHGGEPHEQSGAWGAFAALVTGTAKVIGMKAVLTALQQGEEHGISEYVDAIDNTEIPLDCRGNIERRLLPMCRQHVAALTQLAADEE